jgi:hypothetical protein
VDVSVWQRIKGWFRRKPAEVVPFHAEGMIRPEPDPELRQVLFNHAVSSLVERMTIEPPPPEPEPAQPGIVFTDSFSVAQFKPAVCSCCKCQPSIYRTYGDGTVLCVECAS